MSSVRYIFTDLLSGTSIEELTLNSVTMSNKLNGYGVLRAAFSLDQSGKNNLDIINATVPGKCGLIVLMDDVRVIWDGIVWSRWYQSQAKVVQITARTVEAYADKLLIKSDMSWTSIEQRNIFLNLWSTLQSTSQTNLRLALPGTYSTGITRTLSVLASEYKTYYDVSSGIADGVDGFDWTISTRYENYQFIREMRIGYPTLGASGSGLTFDYPGNVLNYYATESIEEAGTNIYVIGAGEGSDMVVGTYEHTDLLGTGWMRFDTVMSRKDVDNTALIESIADQQALIRRPPATVVKVFVRAEADPVFGSYGLGDTATVAIKDPRFPSGVQVQARIVQFSYSPKSDSSTEQVELIFEGDELNNG